MFYHCSSAPLNALTDSSPKSFVKTIADLARSLAAYADKLMQKTLNSVNNSQWGGTRTHGCLTPRGRQSLRNCCHELNPSCQAGPDLMTTGQCPISLGLQRTGLNWI